jgi:hypothetical protein
MSIDVPTDMARHAAGPLGALTAMMFMHGTPWPQRLAMAVAGAVASYYGAPTVVAIYPQVSPGLAGYLLGLFGLAVVAKLFSTWDALDLGKLLRKRIAAWMGVADEGAGQ